MGLELAELSLEIESRYGVELRADDWANIETFGDLVDSVARRQAEMRDMLASRDAFDAESVRGDVLRVLGGPPEAMSRCERLAASARLHEAFPEISERRLSCWATLFCGVVLASIVFFVVRYLYTILDKNFALFIVVGGLIGWYLTKMLVWFLTPAPCLAVDVIVEEILQHRRHLQETIESRPETNTSESLEEELRTIIATNFAFCDPQEITSASRLVLDLGLG